MTSPPHEPTIFTIGHSTHPIEAFTGLLAEHRIAGLADVRSYPGSRRHPQFNREVLEQSIVRAGIEYVWMKSLGGRRRSNRVDSPHTAWMVEAFRAYADYADTPEFASALDDLIARASHLRLAYMCSEGLWWRCHRRIISDHLVVRGWTVMHIMPDGKLVQHELADFARVEGARIIYDGTATRFAPR